MVQKTASAPRAPSAWPKLKRKDVKVQHVLGQHLMLVPGLLTPLEAGRFVETAESMGFTHQGSRGPRFGEAFRDNERMSVEDPALAQHLWEGTGLCDAMRGVEVDGGAAVGLNPLVRVYRYDKGQRFGRHIDESVEVTSRPRGTTQYTLLIYLSDPHGGDTIFYDGRGRRAASVKPRTGLALLHLHGDECMEHEGAAVTGGTKYVLRSDVVFA